MTTMPPEPAAAEALIPISLITGFLGSGKTTLLNRILRHPGFGDTAVVINEFGEIGLDHRLVEAIDGDMVVMNSGCLCCTVRGDLSNTLRKMYVRRVRGEVPAFKRVIIETTGLADPAPIIHTLMEDPIVDAYFRLDGVIATVDGVNGASQLDAQFEAVKQAAVADRIILTKLDIAEPARVEALKGRLNALNPGAPLLAARQGEVEPEALFDTGLYNPETKSVDVQRWLRAEAYAAAQGQDHAHGHDHGHDHRHDDHGPEPALDVNRHDARIAATCLTFDEPLDWDRFSRWLVTLARVRGDDLLRVKGILNLKGVDQPVAIHGVQQLFHPPAQLSAWPDDDRRSKIVLITRDMDRAYLEGSLNAALAMEMP